MTTLATHPRETRAWEVYELLVGATGELRRWLDVWTKASPGAPDDHVVDPCTEFMHRVHGPRVLLKFWDEHDVTDPVVDWLRHARERLAAAGRDPYPVDLLLFTIDPSW